MDMKKWMITVLCFLALYDFTHARILQLGPRLGISSSQIKIKSPNKQFPELQAATGYQVGFVAQLNLPIVFIQPELLITGSGIQYQQQTQKQKITYTKLELPVMVGMGFLGLAKLQAGPTLSLLLGAQQGQQNIKANYAPLTLGYQVGIGIDIWRLMVDLKYAANLSKFGHQLMGIATDHQQHLLILSVGFDML